ncbi:MAG: LCP family protein [Anaerolineae bacterium]|nr:LCP family protein [Anaerolineae bacterium]
MSSTTSSASKVILERLPVKTLIRIGTLLIYLIVTTVTALVIFARVRESIASSDIFPNLTLNNEPATNSNVELKEGEQWERWTDTDRITFLILGIDERMQEDEDCWRTDTMILATLDPVTMKAGLLSIPRDLWVPIPGYIEERINTALFIGDAYDHPGGGPALAVETVEYNLGVDIDYYARINFQAFVEFVDRIGGIDIDVPEIIDDPDYPTPDFGIERFYVEAGPHHFYGEEALKYARTRTTGGGDFDRMDRQQQVIRAVLKRVSESNMWPQLFSQAPEMLTLLQSSVKLDPQLQLDEVIALANLAKDVDFDNDVVFRAIDEQCTLSKTTPDNMMILVPLRDEIRRVRDEVFGLRTTNGHQETLEEEAATVSVLNGTVIGGLASSTSEYLVANGIPVAAYDNADRQDYESSMIILNRAKPATAQQILTLLHLPESAIVNGANPTAQYDVVVILGADYKSDLP